MLKHLLLTTAAMCAVLSSNAQQKYEIGNPNDSEHYGYLKDYKPLKEYIDTEKYPNFKLGIGTTVSDYLQKGLVYRLTNGYFTETVAGNAMKYGSCVKNDGSMDFTQVKNYVNTATAAGLNVYGHTLAWHSQQNTAYLNGLIKDLPAPPLADGDITYYKTLASKDFTTNQSVGWHASESDFNYTITFDDTNGMKVHNNKKAANFWDVQYVAMDNILTEKGGTYRMTMTVRASAACTLHTRLGDWNSGPSANLSLTTAWKEIQVEYKNTLAGSFLMLQSGDFVGDIYIKKIVIDCPVKGKTVTEDRRCIVVESSNRKKESWETQLWIMTGSFAAGSTFQFSADVRADQDATASTQIHSTTRTYVDYQAIGNPKFTAAWTTWKSSGTLSKAGGSIAFNLNELADGTRYYFDNISLKINGVEKIKNGSLEGTDVSCFYKKEANGAIVPCTITDQISYVYVPSTIPLSAKQKHDTLVYAMDRWIHGMMDACGGKVKAWDVVNEAISGGDADSEGVYALQHDNGSGDFFWQDHMGDLEYVRQAVRLARKYGPSDVKLFINDYNLESDWDNNGKLRSLIKWIERWEADGETRIDGIGSQMHISCYMNETTQASKKRGIEQMLKLMAATGKMVRISELDMGMVDANNKDVTTANMTEAMHQRMADLYEWIVKKYFEIVPVSQQWGICQWCPTDSPSNSGWRADMPVGLWTLDYYRKHVYAGFAKGLGAPDPTDIAEVEVSDEPQIYGTIFNICGAPLPTGTTYADLPTGIYIVNGRKVIKR